MVASVGSSSAISSTAFRHYVRKVLAAESSISASRSRLPRVVTSSALHSSISDEQPLQQQQQQQHMYHNRSGFPSTMVAAMDLSSSSPMTTIEDLVKYDHAFSFSFAEDTKFEHLLAGSCGEVDSRRMSSQLEHSFNQLRKDGSMPAVDSFVESSASSPRTKWKGILLQYPYTKNNGQEGSMHSFEQQQSHEDGQPLAHAVA